MEPWAAARRLHASRGQNSASLACGHGPTEKEAVSRSSSSEVRIRVPFFLWSILVGGTLPQKRVKGHY